RRGMICLIRKRHQDRSAAIGDIVSEHRRQRLPGDPSDDHELGIEINRDWSRRKGNGDRLAQRTQWQSQKMLTVTLHANQQLKEKTKGLVRLDDRGLQLKGLSWLPHDRMCDGLRQRQHRRPILFHPLREKPSEILATFFRKDSLKIAPFRVSATILRHQARKGPPERLLSH